MNRLVDIKQDLIKFKNPTTGVFEPKHHLTFIFEDSRVGVDCEGDLVPFPDFFTVRLRLAPLGLQQLIDALVQMRDAADWSDPPLSVDSQDERQ